MLFSSEEVTMPMVFKCPKCGTIWELDKKLEAAAEFSKENPGLLIVYGERVCSVCKHTIPCNKVVELSYNPNSI